MGRSLVALDTSLLVYLFHARSPFHDEAVAFWRRIERGTDHAVFSQIGMVELLTGPKKRGRLDLALSYRRVIMSVPHLTLAGLSDPIVEIASDLRAKYGLRTPDAIHLGTAIAADADVFLTNDRNLKKVKEIKVELLRPR